MKRSRIPARLSLSPAFALAIFVGCAAETAPPLTPLPPPSNADIDFTEGPEGEPPPRTPAPKPNAEAIDCAPLERAMADAQAFRDLVAASIAEQKFGMIAYHHWIRDNAARRAQALRYLSADYKAELRDTLRASANAISVLGQDASKDAPMAPHIGALADSLKRVNGSCPAADFAAPRAQVHRPEAIQIVVRAHMGDLRKCYEASLRKKPQPSARILFEFRIEKDGVVEDVKVSGDVDDEAMKACMAEAPKQFHFGPSPAPLTIRYPIVFTP